MIAEIGLFSLILALLFAVILVSSSLYSIFSKHKLAHDAASVYVWGLGLFVLTAFGCLTLCFLNNDFTVVYVLSHSSISLPWFYKCCAVWGGHEGSMLLWLLILCGWMAAFSHWSQSIPISLRNRMLVVLGLLSIGLICFILMTSNPFLRQFDLVKTQGNDLNPLLQDIGFLFHPPMLYLGYVGFAVPFAFAIAVLWLGEIDSKWVKWIRPWTLVPWCTLTLGITLGSWWAYRELGWGGFWFWDPVENASFMPWLVGTALIHAWMMVQKRETGIIWSLLLAIVAFSLSLIGTFLVRSGVLTSVHAFAVDPTRGLYILGLLTITIGGSLALFMLRLQKFHTLMPTKMAIWSRESLLYLSQIFLFVAMLTVLLGTVYPLLIDGLGLGKLSVGMPYFNMVFIPLMFPVFVLMGIGIHARWYQETGMKLLKDLFVWLIIAIILTGIILFIFIFSMGQGSTIILGLSVFIAVWGLLTTIYGFYKHLQRKNFKSVGMGYTGMTIAHLGIFITMMGIAVSTGFGIEEEFKLAPGEVYHTKQYQLDFVREENINFKQDENQNYQGMRGVFNFKTTAGQVRISPEKRVYTVGDRVMTEAAINVSFFRDVYLALGERFEDGTWIVRIYIKPLVRWIWLGGIMMFLGGGLAFLKRSKQ